MTDWLIEAARGKKPEPELPEGLYQLVPDGLLYYNCRSCDCRTVFEGEAEEFDNDVAYCGGSDRCLP